MTPLSPVTFKIYNKIYHSKKLEKLAASSSGQAQDNILAKKAALDADLIATIKEAAFNSGSILDGMRKIAPTVGKGMAAGAGAAVPLTAAGMYLSDKATDDARDKALQAGLGIAGLGAGLYGIHKMTQKPEHPMMHSMKYASEESVFHKLASIGMLDYELHDNGANSELIDLNNQNLIDTLFEIIA